MKLLFQRTLAASCLILTLAACSEKMPVPALIGGEAPPTPAELKERLDALEERLAAERAEREQKAAVDRTQLETRLAELERAVGNLRTDVVAGKMRREEMLRSLTALERVIETWRASQPSLGGAASFSPETAGEVTRKLERGRQLLDDGKAGEARALVKTVLGEKITTEHRAKAHLLVGESYYQEKSYNEAILSFHKIVEESPRAPEAPQALLREATCFALLGKEQNASFLFRKLLADYPDSPQAAQVRKDLESTPSPAAQTVSPKP